MPGAQYRDPITIIRLNPDNSPNALGEPATDDATAWQTYFACFGEVIVKGQREFTRAGITDADVSHLIRVPLSKEMLAIDSNMRIILGATHETLHIEDAYRRDASNREVEILCRN